MSAIGHYENGCIVGEWSWWRKNGELWQTGGFDDNELKEGLFTRYHKNGNLHDAGHYHASKKTGEWKFYNEDGSLKQKKTFK